MSPEARERSFDDLARGLASGSISRGKALRLLGAALVGGTLASIPGIAGAAPRVKCTSDADCPSGGVCVTKGGHSFCACTVGGCSIKCQSCAQIAGNDFTCVDGSPFCVALGQPYQCVIPCRA
jgi:hypothetical protein